MAGFQFLWGKNQHIYAKMFHSKHQYKKSGALWRKGCKNAVQRYYDFELRKTRATFLLGLEYLV